MTAEDRPATTGAGPGGTASARAAFWARSLRGWDVAFYLMVVIAAAALVLEAATAARLTASLLGLAVLTAAYTVVGRRAARCGERGRAMAYLAVLVVTTVAIVWVNEAGTLLLFIAYSQIWFFAETRRIGVAVSTALTVGVFGALAAHAGGDPAALADTAAQGGLALAFAVLLGLWITSVAEQSEERADLLERLEAAQAELGRSHHAAGVAAERERMAQEIHDTLAQGLSSIIMLAQTAAADLDRDQPGRAAQRLQLVEQTARDNLAEARALVAAFAPVGLEGATLGEALERLADRFEQETGVEVEVMVRSGPTVPTVSRSQEVILLRAAQEALANVRRHAQARRVQLVLGADADSVTGGQAPVHLEVVDDGQGIDAAATEGFGLRGMRERVASGGGVVAVSSGSDGTRVRVTLPTTGTPDSTAGDPPPTSPLASVEEVRP